MVQIKGLSGDVDIAVDGGTAVSFTDYGVPPATNLLTGGWAEPKFYLPEVDPATDQLVFESGETTIVILCKPDGKSWQDVKSEQSLSQNDLNSVGNQIKNNLSWGYGTSDALAIDMELAEELITNQYSEYFRSPWLLLKRGTDINFASSTLDFDRPGESALHPARVGSYGTGDRPKFQGDAPRAIAGSACFVISDVDVGHNIGLAGLKYIGASNITCDHSHSPGVSKPGIVIGGLDNDGAMHCFARCMKFNDIDQDIPGDGRTNWSYATDRVSSYYAATAAYLLLEKMFDSYSGWNPNYTRNGTGAGGMPPDDRSHGKYIQRNVHMVTVSYNFSLFANFQAGQWRSDCVAQHMFSMASNAGYAFLSPMQESRFSYASDVVQYRGGWKQADHDDARGPATGAEGLTIEMPQMPIYNSLQCNAGTPVYFSTTDPDEVANGPKALNDLGPLQVKGVSFDSPQLAPSLVGSFHPDLTGNHAIANWSSIADDNVTAAQATAIDGKSLGLWLDGHLTQSGNTDDDAVTHLRDQAAPWDLLISASNHFLEPLGWDTATRTTSATCTFSPPGSAFAPPRRADIERNWSTGDLPGSVAGDTITINDDVDWNLTPRNTIAGLTMGANGSLTMYGGALRPSAVTVAAGGNSITLDGGSKFDLPGYSGSGRLTVTVEESRFVNTGTVAGNVDLVSRFKAEAVIAEEGETFTLDSAGSITAYGRFPFWSQVSVGFDGYAGGTATANINGTLNFKTGCWMIIDGLSRGSKNVGSSGSDIYVADYKLPKIGDVVTNSGATASGVVRKILNVNPVGGTSNIYLYLTDTVGVFADNDTLTSTDLWMRDIFQEDTGGNFGAVNGTPTYTIGLIGDVITGRGPQVGDLPAGVAANGHGATPPSVNSVLTLSASSAVTVQTAGLASGTYDLIDVDSLTDNGATLPSGVAVSGNKLVLTVS